MESATERYIDDLEAEVKELRAENASLRLPLSTGWNTMNDKDYLSMKSNEGSSMEVTYDADPKTWNVPAEDHLWTRSQYGWIRAVALAFFIVAVGFTVRGAL